MAKIKRNAKTETQIPTTSMGDISFLLLLFFMVSTVFVEFKGLPVNLPKAREIQKIPRKHTTTIYVDKKGTTKIDDLVLNSKNQDKFIEAMQFKKAEDPNTTACFRTDEETQYSAIDDRLEWLKIADVLRVQFEAKLKGK